MPGFIIHIAVGKRYIEKHKSEIKKEEPFYKGLIAPDFEDNMISIAKDKTKTHFGNFVNNVMKIDFKKFLNSKIDAKDDFGKGYFLHLITDYYFYNKNFKLETQAVIQNKDGFYHDYDCLNKDLIKKYQFEILDFIKTYIHFLDEEPKYLDKNKIINFIEEISNLNLNDFIKKIKQNEMEGI